MNMQKSEFVNYLMTKFNLIGKSQLSYQIDQIFFEKFYEKTIKNHTLQIKISGEKRTSYQKIMQLFQIKTTPSRIAVQYVLSQYFRLRSQIQIVKSLKIKKVKSKKYFLGVSFHKLDQVQKKGQNYPKKNYEPIKKIDKDEDEDKQLSENSFDSYQESQDEAEKEVQKIKEKCEQQQPAIFHKIQKHKEEYKKLEQFINYEFLLKNQSKISKFKFNCQLFDRKIIFIVDVPSAMIQGTDEKMLQKNCQNQLQKHLSLCYFNIQFMQKDNQKIRQKIYQIIENEAVNLQKQMILLQCNGITKQIEKSRNFRLSKVKQVTIPIVNLSDLMSFLLTGKLNIQKLPRASLEQCQKQTISYFQIQEDFIKFTKYLNPVLPLINMKQVKDETSYGDRIVLRIFNNKGLLLKTTSKMIEKTLNQMFQFQKCCISKELNNALVIFVCPILWGKKISPIWQFQMYKKKWELDLNTFTSYHQVSQYFDKKDAKQQIRKLITKGYNILQIKVRLAHLFENEKSFLDYYNAVELLTRSQSEKKQ